ncbi:MAG TPA: hypothetical protein DCS97_01870 [Planctomycetes bacterium]|nr:hypothetical protein [Planctomycetota bacterium]
MSEQEPSVVAADIASAIGALPILRPLWVRPVLGYHAPLRSSATGRPRITIVIDGIRPVLAPVDGRVVEHRLVTGDALIVAADGWTQPRPQRPNRIVAINSFDDGTRFEAPQGLSFHSAAPLNPVARSLFSALIQAGEDAGQRPSAPDLLRLLVRAALADCRPWPQADRARLAWARARAHAYEHPGSGREALAAAAGVHPNHLSRLCRRIEGQPLITWITGVRMERARALLAAGLDAGQIATACGYGEASHFRRTFRKQHGLPPGAWAVAAARPLATVPS